MRLFSPRQFILLFLALTLRRMGAGLRQSPHVTIRLQKASEQFEPSQARRGEKSVGLGDRGVGLVYRDGRPASSKALVEPKKGHSLEYLYINISRFIYKYINK